MKKLIASIVAGAVLVGIGIGVLFLEVAEFTSAEYLPYIMEDKINTYTISDSEIFGVDNNNTVTIDVYMGVYFEDNKNIKIVEDHSVNGVEIDISYRGTKPHFQFWDYDGDEQMGSNYGLNVYSNDWMPKDVLKAAKYMCQNKVFVRDPSNYYVETITIRTNKPNKLNIKNF